MNFNQLNLSEFIYKALEKKGLESCTEIQEKTIPLLLRGEDVIGKSRTGSGKTFAFGIPAVMGAKSELDYTQALVVCPTRELAMQVCEQLRFLNSCREGCKVIPLVGGVNMARQVNYLKKNCQIVVGTPGRINDHLRRRTLKLDGLSMLILDEADEMLKMGFKEDIENIFSKSPPGRNTVMFSATMPEEILRLARTYMNNPKFIETDDLVTRSVNQFYVSVGLKSKDVSLKKLIKRLKPAHSIVFCNTKRMVEKLTASLLESNVKAIGIHGDMRTAERKMAMESLKGREVNLLIATDVAARGIDVDGVDIVFNYDVPQTAEYYTHRIGRTGRADKVGMAITLINTAWGMQELQEICDVTGNYVQELELDLGEKQAKGARVKPQPTKSIASGKKPLRQRVKPEASGKKSAPKADKGKQKPSFASENQGDRLKSLRDMIDGDKQGNTKQKPKSKASAARYGYTPADRAKAEKWKSKPKAKRK